MNKIFYTFVLSALVLLSVQCNPKSQESDEQLGNDSIIEYAELLSITSHDDYTDVKISNPWDSARLLHRYILVPRQLNAILKKSKNHFKKDYISNPASQLYERNGLNYCWQPLLAGGGTATVWKEIRKGNKSVLVISNAHSFPETDALKKAETALANLQTADISLLRQAHRDWWHNYYPQSFISLPDKKIENFYWAQMYKLASATRVGGGLLDNSGPWQVLTPWPNTWWNLNVQLSYWPVYASNRLELGMPMVDAINNNFENLINNVPEAYRKDAAALPVATDFNLVGVDVATNFISSKLMAERFDWTAEQVKFAPQVYFLSRTVGALLGAFLLARIAEMKYFRVNIVACIFSLLILAFVKNDMVNLICIGAVGFFASSVFSIIYSMALQARPEKANQISGLMITAVAGGGVVTPVIGFAIGIVGVIGGVFVTLACVCYLTYCAFGVKTAKA